MNSEADHTHADHTMTTAGILKAGLASLASAALLIAGGSTSQAALLNDINGDSLPDLVFQDSGGGIAGWFLDGTGNAVDVGLGTGIRPGTGVLSTVSLGDWKLRASSDIDGDHLADFIFQNSAGHIAAWLLDGTGDPVDFASGQGLKAAPQMISDVALGDWKLNAMEDIDSDLIADFIFQNSAGQLIVWLLDGSGDAVNFGTGQGLKSAPRIISALALADWKLQTVQDTDGDDLPELLFQNDAGHIAAWSLDGTGNTVDFVTGAGLISAPRIISSVSLGDWRLKVAQDTDGDGIPDFVFQNGIGQIVAWPLDGSGGPVDLVSGAGLRAAPKFIFSGNLGGWRIVGGE